MNIVLLGYGKMGKVIEKIALSRGHNIVARIDVNNRSEFDALTAADVDAVIEFSHPLSAYENVKTCIEKGIPVVSGTTGWLEKKPELEALTLEKGSAFFWSSNYSIGVNIFFKLNKMLAKLMNPQKQYSVSTTEIHHTEKKDSPSGTAITIAEGLIENLAGKEKWINNEIPADNEVAIWSAREGRVPGTHIVKYISDIDQIEILHQAHGREGFALGAVIAAEWIADKKGVFGMDDLLAE
ncbi:MULTISPECIES: 4-hydroxy-tetrahydrodipicolinate reductase [Bacteroidota]|uniref:4-hydroxy-tetrahydrodipicolinate reductase n=1 Tax=Flectobacillus rivi TaxID=2984209 RepID=A0ABT6Z1C5_9BACT|nr:MULTISPECIES: 4-hydroxy-tetrahydrodipicolinate reductase [Bacteroidota]MDI9874434.1 4-hydroxy-tetrahydrodipicolinate reductase [Flectobacillus rivi]NBB26827.1 4-hydroxy-tetrahydrodipicolinate reductase [Cellulophaga sp. BC115SP]